RTDLCAAVLQIPVPRRPQGFFQRYLRGPAGLVAQLELLTDEGRRESRRPRGQSLQRPQATFGHLPACFRQRLVPGPGQIRLAVLQCGVTLLERPAVSLPRIQEQWF